MSKAFSRMEVFKKEKLKLFVHFVTKNALKNVGYKNLVGTV